MNILLYKDSGYTYSVLNRIPRTLGNHFHGYQLREVLLTAYAVNAVCLVESYPWSQALNNQSLDLNREREPGTEQWKGKELSWGSEPGT